MRKLGCFLMVLSLSLLFFGRWADAGTLVDFNFANFGTVQVDLFDDLTPATVTNFKSYVNNGSYTNTIIHRSVPNFVIQGGGFNTQGQAITTSAPIPLEYSRANTRGTISMARTTDINSATSQFFFSTVNNTTSLGPGNGGGYAVFGWVLSGMNVIDSIAAVPTFNYLDPFGEVPLQNFTQADFNNHVPPLPHVITLTGVNVVSTHPSYQNPVSLYDVNNDGLVKPQDALVVINDLLANGTHSLGGPFSGTNYLDTTGDGKVSPLDALRVINALRAQPASGSMPSVGVSPMGSLDSTASMALVPEPSSIALAAAGFAALGGYACRRRLLRRRAAQNV